ncbi:hypothetical protein CBR_g52198 [Chara braunii]|uniref:Uncharacterized protein n=1 Tax=Chara braunii TaxID=69332 RepID=A0A388MA23_CHABU|nr:hypothetical protein CBR_g52198 [Chara braunii]|eukprot:GBG91312.1 hypothetical protein CBR_g52198 [Chara braunii]
MFLYPSMAYWSCSIRLQVLSRGVSCFFPGLPSCLPLRWSESAVFIYERWVFALSGSSILLGYSYGLVGRWEGGGWRGAESLLPASSLIFLDLLGCLGA